jgi:ABC-type multidrug transport system ATPase subunit
MRQRLGIAQALVGDPDLVIVDEPTAGLDPEERVRFRNLLSGMSGRRLVLLSTHIVSDVESIAGEIAVVRGGRLVTAGPPEALIKRAAGMAWEAVLSSTEFEGQRERLTVSSLVRRGDGVHLRLVAAEQPLSGATSVEPDLEDAYLALMQPWFGAAA